MTKKNIYILLILSIFISQFILINLQVSDPDQIVTYFKSFTTNQISTYKSYLDVNGGYSDITTYDEYFYQISTIDKQHGTNGNIKFPQVKISDEW